MVLYPDAEWMYVDRKSCHVLEKEMRLCFVLFEGD